MAKKFILLGVILLSFCAPKERTEVRAPAPELEKKLREADLLGQRANYVAFKQAFETYSGLYTHSFFRTRVASKLARTALLLTVRQKELGIVDKTCLDKALEIIKESPSLATLTPYAEIAGVYWVQGKGIMRDIDERFSWIETSGELKKMDAVLREKARTDEFGAYM